MRHAISRIGVRVEKDTEPFKFVLVSKNGPDLCAIFGKPHRHAISRNALSVPVDFELEFNLPARGGERKLAVDPAAL
jgi:hypothetical protein